MRGVCDKPRIRCSACLNQAFAPVTDQEILGHLQGRHAMGIYPLLEDATCWLLAVDFDKASCVPVLQRMFERRLRGYRAIGYSMDKAES